MVISERYNKELPSSDAETDKMEGMDERESQLEHLANGNLSENLDNSKVSTNDKNETNGNGAVLENDSNDKKRSLDTVNEPLERSGSNTKKVKVNGTTTNGGIIQRDSEDGTANLKSASESLKHTGGEADEEEDEDVGEYEDEDDDETKNSEKVNGSKHNNFKSAEIEKGIDNENENQNQNDIIQSEIEEEEEQRENNRVIAMNRLKDIEILFAQLKDKLYETQLNKLEFELKLCQSNKHPELLEYMKMVDEDFQKKAERLMNLQKYRLKCLDNQTRANRVALHQQFMKSRQDLKHKEVFSITTDWYDINKERRTMDMQTLKLPEYYQYNQSINSSNIKSYLSSLVHQRNSVYKELSTLQGLIDYKQMLPSSLNNLKGCSEDEINKDLKEMGLI